MNDKGKTMKELDSESISNFVYMQTKQNAAIWTYDRYV